MMASNEGPLSFLILTNPLPIFISLMQPAFVLVELKTFERFFT